MAGEEQQGLYKSLYSLLTSSVLLIIAKFFDQFVSFFRKVLISRYLGRIDYGSVALGITTLSVVQIIAMLGLSGGIARNLSRTEGEVYQKINIQPFSPLILSVVPVSIIYYLLLELWLTIANVGGWVEYLIIFPLFFMGYLSMALVFLLNKEGITVVKEIEEQFGITVDILHQVFHLRKRLIDRLRSYWR